MPTIDSHVHLGPWDIDYFYGLKSTIQMLESTYKDYYGLLVIPTDRYENEITKRILDKTSLNTKFAAWGTPDNFDEICNMEFDAIKLHPALSRTPVINDSYTDLISLAEVREVPVIIHCGGILETDYHYVLNRAKEYPQVKFVINHLGGRSYQKQWNCPIDSLRYRNVYIDTTMRIMYWTIEHAQSVVGSGRMLFGSDYPLIKPEVGVQAIMTSNVNHEDILFNTAHKLFWEE